jgi:hypothetical protein
MSKLHYSHKNEYNEEHTQHQVHEIIYNTWTMGHMLNSYNDALYSFFSAHTLFYFNPKLFYSLSSQYLLLYVHSLFGTCLYVTIKGVYVCFMHLFRFANSVIMAGYYFHVEVTYDCGTSHIFNQ